MITVFSMSTCPDCVTVKEKLQGDERFHFVDIGEHVLNLRAFLQVRDNNAAFNCAKANGSIGIPCFVLPNGKVFFNLEEIPTKDFTEISSSAETSVPKACNLDGSGC